MFPFLIILILHFFDPVTSLKRPLEFFLFHIPHARDDVSWSVSLLLWSAFRSGLPLNHLTSLSTLQATAHLAFLKDFLSCWVLTTSAQYPVGSLTQCLGHSRGLAAVYRYIPVMVHSIPKWWLVPASGALTLPGEWEGCRENRWEALPEQAFHIPSFS